MKATRLLKKAAALFDNPAHQLSRKADPIRGFSGGGEWMRHALSIIRNRPIPVRPDIPFHWLGFAKYALASLVALLVLGIGLFLGWPWGLLALPGIITAFYAVEVQFVFLFPLAIDGYTAPWSAARAMTRHLGTPQAMAVVLPLAVVMLTGGFLGRGFIRSWCLGCLAVVLWYEEERIAQRQISVRLEKISGPVPLRLLWVSDLHLDRENCLRLGTRLLRTARHARPDYIILGGDLVEDTRILPNFVRLLNLLARLAPTHAIPGNHDARAGLHAIREAVGRTNATWHDDPGFALHLSNGRSQTIPLGHSSHPKDSLIFMHDPKHLDQIKSGWLVAFAGHLHGGQGVFWRRGEREYPGAWLSRWNGPRFHTPKGTVLVSRGVTDTFSIRWNCPKEVILCEIS